MNEKYSKNLTDAQLDEIVNKLLREAMPPSETIEQIADSPQLLWKVKSNIAAEKARHQKQGFFAWRWQVLAFGVLALVFGSSAAVFLLNSTNKEEIAAIEKPQMTTSPNDETPEVKLIKPIETTKAETKPEISVSRKSELKIERTKIQIKNEPQKLPLKIEKVDLRVVKTPKNKAVQSKNNVVTLREKEEAKTDFIPLSYAANSESGQIVRVKVPRSMMVSLGVAANSEQRQAELVNAELVLGDDGLARAIRFVKEQR